MDGSGCHPDAPWRAPPLPMQHGVSAKRCTACRQRQGASRLAMMRIGRAGIHAAAPAGHVHSAGRVDGLKPLKSRRQQTAGRRCVSRVKRYSTCTLQNIVDRFISLGRSGLEFTKPVHNTNETGVPLGHARSRPNTGRCDSAIYRACAAVGANAKGPCGIGHSWHYRLCALGGDFGRPAGGGSRRSPCPVSLSAAWPPRGRPA
jgi:hypothetical protein